jgi:hypothetical protein
MVCRCSIPDHIGWQDFESRYIESNIAVGNRGTDCIRAATSNRNLRMPTHCTRMVVSMHTLRVFGTVGQCLGCLWIEYVCCAMGGVVLRDADTWHDARCPDLITLWAVRVLSPLTKTLAGHCKAPLSIFLSVVLFKHPVCLAKIPTTDPVQSR